MYCSQCGVKATGRFCHQCGSPLQTPDASLTPGDDDSPSDQADWEQDARYEQIVRVAAVRTVIARHAAAAPKGLSGEAILALYDRIVASPIPLEKLAAVVQPLYASWGIRTGKERTEVVGIPIGRAIARTLCSFARHGQTFHGAEQSAAGCALTADLPSSVCALKGTLTISLVRHRQQTRVAASTDIPGQMYDWGKSHRSLDQLFSDLKSNLGLPASSRQAEPTVLRFG